tara:strand:+ start:86 stop:460 length:375 start_codon:yes stop_codon:yes gene_type:complete
MKKTLLSIILIFSISSHAMTVSEFEKVMKTQINYPEDMTLYFTGLMSSALMFNALSLDMSGKRMFCSPRNKMHKVEEHIQITNWFITKAGETMRSEYRKMGRNFDEIEISEAYALALINYYSCD